MRFIHDGFESSSKIRDMDCVIINHNFFLIVSSFSSEGQVFEGKVLLGALPLASTMLKPVEIPTGPHAHCNGHTISEDLSHLAETFFAVWNHFDISAILGKSDSIFGELAISWVFLKINFDVEVPVCIYSVLGSRTISGFWVVIRDDVNGACPITVTPSIISVLWLTTFMIASSISPLISFHNIEFWAIVSSNGSSITIMHSIRWFKWQAIITNSRHADQVECGVAATAHLTHVNIIL